MELYSIQQSEKEVGKAYSQLMNQISSHVTLLAKHGKPITSVMGIKRRFYRFKKQLVVGPLEAVPSPEGGRAIIPMTEELTLLIGDVQDKFDMDIQEVVEAGLICEKEIKKALAKYDYHQMVKNGSTGRDAKRILSEKYGFSTSMIEKLIYVRRTKKN